MSSVAPPQGSWKIVGIIAGGAAALFLLAGIVLFATRKTPPTTAATVSPREELQFLFKEMRSVHEEMEGGQGQPGPQLRRVARMRTLAKRVLALQRELKLDVEATNALLGNLNAMEIRYRAELP